MEGTFGKKKVYTSSPHYFKYSILDILLGWKCRQNEQNKMKDSRVSQRTEDFKHNWTNMILSHREEGKQECFTWRYLVTRQRECSRIAYLMCRSTDFKYQADKCESSNNRQVHIHLRLSSLCKRCVCFRASELMSISYHTVKAWRKKGSLAFSWCTRWGQPLVRHIVFISPLLHCGKNRLTFTKLRIDNTRLTK